MAALQDRFTNELMKEVVPHVEKNFGVIADRDLAPRLFTDAAAEAAKAHVPGRLIAESSQIQSRVN